MIAALYVRVSTEEQAEHGFSIDVQKERLIAFSKSQGWDDYKLYIDDGYTGTKIERPALKKMIRHIEEGKIHTVVVFKLDRLSRRQKDVLQLLEDVFEKNNVKFRSSTEPFDTSTPFGKAMLGVLAVFAQLDRDMIIERTTSGRRQKVSQGQWYGGRVPFGYKWNKEAKTLEIVPEDARIIKEIYNLYLQGQSRLSIAEWASSRTNERTIDHNIVRDILARPIYVGKLKNAGKVNKGNHEAIIDQETWDRVQAETLKRKDGATPLGEYLLTGLLKCGVCGGNIVHVKRITRKKDKEYIYELYACKQQHVRQKDRDNNCSLGYVRREKVEKFIIDQVKSFELFPKKIKQIIDSKNEGFYDQEITVDNLKSQLKKIDTNLENLYDAIQSGDIKASAVSDRIRKLEEQREVLENDIDDLNSDIPELNDSQTIEMVSQISMAWDYFTEDEQKAALRKLITCVILHGKENDPEIEWSF